MTSSNDVRRIAETVRYLRGFGFLQHGQAHEEMVLGNRRPPLAAWDGDPIPMHENMTDDEVAECLLSIWRRNRRNIPAAAEQDALDAETARYDPSRTFLLDWENTSAGDEMYVRTVEALARVSRGVFKPSEIKEEWAPTNGQVIHVSFLFDGRQRQIALEQSGRSMENTPLLRTVDEMLVDHPYHFYIWTTSFGEMVVALTPEEKAQLQNRGWALRVGGVPWSSFKSGKEQIS